MTLRGVEEVTRALDADRAMAGLKKELRDAAALVKRAASANVSNRVLHRRSGDLATSIAFEIESDGFTARVGAGKGPGTYGAAHEFGATIKPTGGRKFLTIPLEKSLKPARQEPNLTFATTRKGQWLLVDKNTGKAKFLLRRQVVIPKRPWLLPAYESNKDRIVSTFQASLQRSLMP